ncbi:unnamed protein product [Rhizoctonia solani]|uniref:Metacaspase-1 n=1 Tax=Rhizoctonia solani TaxID=456999 RepID=A0A8H2XVW5_9AGAM|nr:unnamed protein product [Rhizoctonia solani]
MGKPSNPQPTHSTIGAVPVHRRRSRSKTRSRRDSVTKPSVTIPSPSPSPLTSSLEQYYDAEEYIPLPPDVDGDVFYDLYEPSEHKPVFATVRQVIPEPEHDGACKGRIGKQPTRTPPSFPPVNTLPTPSTPAPTIPLSFGRGQTKTTVDLGPGNATTNPIAEEARKIVEQTPPPPRKPVKKALVVGINYASWGDDKRLYYAVSDAKLWRETFMSKGVELGNIKIITDEGDMRYAPTYHNLLAHIRWLVHDAKDGDSLFFVYSGHAFVTRDYGPCIVTADKVTFPRPILEKELVMSVPAGVDLQVVFDCCHSAGMIGLQYCVGRMAKPTLSRAEQPTECTTEEPTASPRQFPHSPQHASLYGISSTDTAPTPTPSQPPPPVIPEPDTFGSLPQRPPRGGVVAAPPLTAATATPAGTQPGGAAVGAVRYLGSFLGLGSSSPPAPPPVPVQPEPSAARAPGPRRACQGVAEGARTADYFEERKNGFVDPAAKVMVWAGTGEAQKAFESYGGARQGVVTKAMCAAFERITTRRDLWSYLVQEIESENTKRSRRDADKSPDRRPPMANRIQHAELWVSQAHLADPSLALPVLDQPIL